MNHKGRDPEQNRDIHFSVDSAPLHSRRRALKAALAGGAAITAGSVSGNSVPAKWVAPAVESVILPAHATTSIASRIATCCVDYCNLSVEASDNVTVNDANYCDGIVTVNGGGAGPGTWGGSGAVTPEQGSIDFNGPFEYEGTFEFTVMTALTQQEIVISGVVSCTGIVGSYGAGLTFSGGTACG